MPSAGRPTQSADPLLLVLGACAPRCQPGLPAVDFVCTQKLEALIDEDGVFDGSRKLVDDEGDVCLDFAVQYVLAQALLIVAALSVVFINTLLKVRSLLVGFWVLVVLCSVFGLGLGFRCSVVGRRTWLAARCCCYRHHVNRARAYAACCVRRDPLHHGA